MEVERTDTDLWTRFIHLLQKDPILSAETPKSLIDLKDISACAAEKSRPLGSPRQPLLSNPHPNKSPGSYHSDKGALRHRSKSNNGQKSEHDTGTEAKSQKLTLIHRERDGTASVRVLCVYVCACVCHN